MSPGKCLNLSEPQSHRLSEVGNHSTSLEIRSGMERLRTASGTLQTLATCKLMLLSPWAIMWMSLYLTITLLGGVRWYPVFNYYQPHSHTSSYTCVGPRDLCAEHQNPRTPWSPGYFPGNRGLSGCFRVPQCTEYILQTGEPGAA